MQCRPSPEDRLPYIDELVARKREGAEKGGLEADDFAFHQSEFQRLLSEMEAAAESSPLPAEVTGREAMNDLLLRLRGVGCSQAGL